MILNLAYPENSRVQFKISKFPDGQQTIDLIDWNQWKGYIDPIIIKSRLNSFKDLELIICANQAIKNMDQERKVHLYVPYFLGSRSDRKFQDGGVNYLKQVICPIINSQNFASVTVIDPHSDVLESCLNNYIKKDNHELVRWSLSEVDNKDGAQNRLCLVSPDAGAYKKIFDVAKYFKVTNLVTATKVRDLVTGNILKTEVPNLPISLSGNELKCVIIDDIIDGGRTFIELSKAIKEQRPDAKVYLIVTHGIFSAGLYELSKHLDGIFSTNSYSDIDVESHSDYIVNKNYLKQLNIF
jgi:ribose-phosphate pyrophosphokinase